MSAADNQKAIFGMMNSDKMKNLDAINLSGLDPIKEDTIGADVATIVNGGLPINRRDIRRGILRENKRNKSGRNGGSPNFIKRRITTNMPPGGRDGRDGTDGRDLRNLRNLRKPRIDAQNPQNLLSSDDDDSDDDFERIHGSLNDNLYQHNDDVYKVEYNTRFMNYRRHQGLDIPELSMEDDIHQYKLADESAKRQLRNRSQYEFYQNFIWASAWIVEKVVVSIGYGVKLKGWSRNLWKQREEYRRYFDEMTTPTYVTNPRTGEVECIPNTSLINKINMTPELNLIIALIRSAVQYVFIQNAHNIVSSMYTIESDDDDMNVENLDKVQFGMAPRMAPGMASRMASPKTPQQISDAFPQHIPPHIPPHIPQHRYNFEQKNH